MILIVRPELIHLLRRPDQLICPRSSSWSGGSFPISGSGRSLLQSLYLLPLILFPIQGPNATDPLSTLKPCVIPPGIQFLPAD
ncbi:hypothetical protein SDJN02_07294 [Cucurbita argyrosperma subsp. argyrosperma]|nr:hypothetical protein SDJN02_07294 [Cucurbita argyrosperma subsp. argyrosperma]